MLIPLRDGKALRRSIINRENLIISESSGDVTFQTMSNFFMSSLFKLAFLIEKKVKLGNKN